MRTLAILLLPVLVASAAPARRAPQIGDRYEITRLSDTSSEDSNSGTSSTHDFDSFAERVTGISDAGIELEFDLPANTKAEDRQRQWHLPARILKPASGPLQLLNEAELEARLATWLNAGKMTRDACGHWIFTWNAFQIDCDPQSVIESYAYLDFSREDVRDGVPYHAPGAGAAGLLRKAGANRYVAEMAVDPEFVRSERAGSDVVVGEIMRKPTTLETALRARAGEEISGTIAVTFDLDAAGAAWRRILVTKLRIKEADGKVENRTATLTVERKRLSPAS